MSRSASECKNSCMIEISYLMRVDDWYCHKWYLGGLAFKVEFWITFNMLCFSTFRYLILAIVVNFSKSSGLLAFTNWWVILFNNVKCIFEVELHCNDLIFLIVASISTHFVQSSIMTTENLFWSNQKWVLLINKIFQKTKTSKPKTIFQRIQSHYRKLSKNG